MLDQPKIMLSTPEQWAEYHRLKSIDYEKQLKGIAALLLRLVRLGIAGKGKDVHMLGQRATIILRYPRDRNPLIEELARHPDLFGSVLRDGPLKCHQCGGEPHLDECEKRTHYLLPHSGAAIFPDAPRDFHALEMWLAGRDIEGLVFHHPDGRMAKIKLRDFGLKRTPSAKGGE